MAANSLSGATGASRKEVVVNAGADRNAEPFDFLDATFHVKVSGKDTEGRCVIFDTIRHQKIGPALHIHTDGDEWFFVKEGQFKFQAGDKILRLSQIDRHAPTAVKMEEFFRIVSKQADQSVEARKRIGERYGMRYVGPPLTPD